MNNSLHFLSFSAQAAKLVLQLLIELSNFTMHWVIERIINSTLKIRKLRQGEEMINWRSHREWETDKSQISPSSALSTEHCYFSSETAIRNETQFKEKQLKQHFIKDKSFWNSFYAGDPKHCSLLSLSHCFKCRLSLLPCFLHHYIGQDGQHMHFHLPCSPLKISVCMYLHTDTAVYAHKHHFCCTKAAHSLGLQYLKHVCLSKKDSSIQM